MEKKYLLFALCSFMTMSFVSCDNDDDPKPEIPTESSTTGVYFLNAGKLGSNNSTGRIDSLESNENEKMPAHRGDPAPSVGGHIQ